MNTNHGAEKPTGSSALSVEEARVLMWYWGTRAAAARVAGVHYSTFTYWARGDDREYRERKNAWNKRSRKRRFHRDPDYRERERVRGREHYWNLRDKGVCTRCGKKPPISDTRCWDCLNKMEEERAITL